MLTGGEGQVSIPGRGNNTNNAKRVSKSMVFGETVERILS